MCIGAEHINLTTQPTADCQLPCTVVGEEFNGSMVNVYLETRDGLELQVQRPNADYHALELKAGQTVYAGWADARALILRGN